jgi:hypothetical protein
VYFSLLIFSTSPCLVRVLEAINSIGSPEVINFNKQQYGAHYQNWDATQDPLTGFMYFANSKGMLEYDGSNWKTFELPRKQIVRSVVQMVQAEFIQEVWGVLVTGKRMIKEP